MSTFPLNSEHKSRDSWCHLTTCWNWNSLHYIGQVSPQHSIYWPTHHQVPWDGSLRRHERIRTPVTGLVWCVIYIFFGDLVRSYVCPYKLTRLACVVHICDENLTQRSYALHDEGPRTITRKGMHKKKQYIRFIELKCFYYNFNLIFLQVSACIIKK